jgi:hypothetical protein
MLKRHNDFKKYLKSYSNYSYSLNKIEILPLIFLIGQKTNKLMFNQGLSMVSFPIKTNTVQQ